MIEITQKPISPELVVNKVKTDSSGCVVTYIGLIRKYSRGKQVLSVEYSDPGGKVCYWPVQASNTYPEKGNLPRR